MQVGATAMKHRRRILHAKIDSRWISVICLSTVALAGLSRARTCFAAPAAPTFYKHILPILQNHCQACHRSGEIAPMPLVTYRQVKPYAAVIREMVRTKKMPPWFADSRYGRFANDHSLSEQ